MPTRTPRDYYEEAKAAAKAHLLADFPDDEHVWDTVIGYLDKAFDEAEDVDEDTNFVGALMELSQRDGFEVDFSVEDLTSSADAPQFQVTCRGCGVVVDAVASSKKAAKRQAAANMLRELRR